MTKTNTKWRLYIIKMASSDDLPNSSPSQPTDSKKNNSSIENSPDPSPRKKHIGDRRSNLEHPDPATVKPSGPISESTSPKEDPKPAFHDPVKNLKGFCLIVGVLLFAVVAFRLMPSGPACSKPLVDVKANFKNQGNTLWSVMNLILGKRDQEESQNELVSTLILLYEPSAAETASCLAERLAETFACTKNSSRAAEEGVRVFLPEDLNVASHSILERLKGKGKSQAVIVKDTADIAPQNARVFHVLCDDITKFNEPAFYIFLVGIERGANGRNVEIARAILETAWSDLPFNILNPLMSRVLGFSHKVVAEPHIPCSLPS